MYIYDEIFFKTKKYIGKDIYPDDLFKSGSKKIFLDTIDVT